MTKQNKKPAAKPNAAPTAAANAGAAGAGSADANLTGAAAAVGATDTAAAGVTDTAAAGAAGTSAAGVTGADKSAAKKQKVKALQVVSKVEGFRRAGIVFGRTETTVKLSELDDAQVELIKGEPLFTVSEVEVDAE